jgi:hypothetical protein
MSDEELILDEDKEKDPFFKIETKQDVDDIIDKLDSQLSKIYEMNTFYNIRTEDAGKSAARITPKRMFRMKGYVKSPMPSAIKIKERIVGNFSIRKKGRSLFQNSERSGSRRRFR